MSSFGPGAGYRPGVPDIKRARRPSRVADPYAAAQKKIPGWAKNAYLVLTNESRRLTGTGNVMTNSTPTTIKKYANRRLYNTASSAYVTLADLAKMVKGGEDFVVYDAKTNEDITRSVLTQIIFEQEGIEGQSLLPTTFLRQLIRFYGDSMQALLPSYLELSIDRFSGEQDVWSRRLLRRLLRRAAGPDQKEPRRVQSGAGDVLAIRRRDAAHGIAPAEKGEFRGRHRRTAQSALRHAEAPRIAGQEELRRWIP